MLNFCQALGKALIAAGCRVATGLGVGVGDAVFTGALREVMRTKDSIADTLILRPFPQHAGTDAERDKIWEEYRQELTSHVGIGVFLFGNKIGDDGQIVVADGVFREFQIAQEQGVVCLPIGATGFAASDLAKKALAAPRGELSSLDADDLKVLEKLSHEEKVLDDLVEPLVGLIAKLQGKVLK